MKYEDWSMENSWAPQLCSTDQNGDAGNPHVNSKRRTSVDDLGNGGEDMEHFQEFYNLL